MRYGVAGDTIFQMTKSEKRLDRMRKNPRNVSLEDFEAAARQYGVIVEGGKHPRVRFPGYPYPLPYVRENPIPKIYVRDLLQIIEEI